MSSRERVLIAIAHEEPDRVPLYADFTRPILRKLEKLFGCSQPELGLRLGNDIILLKPLSLLPVWVSNNLRMEFKDEWGTKYKKVGNYYERVEYPLSKIDELTDFHIPDPLRSDRYEEMREIIDKYSREFVIIGNVTATLFERACWLRGQAKFMEDMLINKDYANELLDRIMEFSFQGGKKLIDLGVDILYLGDDVGMQTGMIISPQLWRECLKLRYAKLIEGFKQKNPQIKVAFHSDGYIEPIIPEFIEIGIDILNPVQPTCMDPAKIKRRYGDKIIIWGLIDIQRTLPFGKPEDVETEVKLRIQSAGVDGGLILSPCHFVQADTPIENILTFYESGRQYGKYPFKNKKL